MARILIGTSGWHYGSWRGPFFPRTLLLRHQLRYYASQLPSAELNGVFYRTPTTAAVEGWRSETGKDFVFAWKASKFITHWKRLGPSSVNSIELMEDRLRLLGAKAGPVLFQLPPQFKVNPQRLAAFIPMLPHHRRYAIEFRDPGWYRDEVFALLRNANWSLCLSDHHDAPAPWVRTADFIYVRGHGPSGRYHGNYSRSTLDGWAERVLGWQRQGHDSYVYFDNDQKSAAPHDALLLRALIETAHAGKAARGRNDGAPVKRKTPAASQRRASGSPPAKQKLSSRRAY